MSSSVHKQATQINGTFSNSLKDKIHSLQEESTAYEAMRMYLVDAPCKDMIRSRVTSRDIFPKPNTSTL